MDQNKFINRTSIVLAALGIVVSTLFIGLGPVHATGALTASDITSNNEINATATTQTIAYTTPAASITNGSIKLAFGAQANLTGTLSDVFVDFSNISGGNQVTAGTVVYTTGVSGTVVIPFTGTLDVGRIVTIVVGNITNGATAGSASVTVTDYASVDGSGSALDTGTASITLASSSVTQNVKVGRALTWTMTGNTTHQYVVDPANNPTDTNANSISVQTNASSYEVRIYNTQRLTSGAQTITSNFTGFTTSDATPVALAGGSGQIGFAYGVGTVVGSSKSAFSAGTYTDFAITSDPGATHNVVLSKATPTGSTASSATVTYKVGVDYTVPSGNYTTTTIYVVTPTYN